MLSKSLLAAGSLAVALALFAPPASRAQAPAVHAPLFAGLESQTVPAASASPLAQRYFAQAIVLTWGFNPAEATRSFDGSIAADPRCALCYWGLAWSLGPTINTDMADDAAPRIRVALARAHALSRRAPARDRALIDALRTRHPPAGEPANIDEDAYAARMRALARMYPRDAGVATLAAEAIMNLHPYDWWDKDGAPRAWTVEIAALLSRALAIEPRHPGANHYWIHLMESSARPDDALASAERLVWLVPGSGHLLHMPAHIYMRTGRYADAVAASERSIAADTRYLAQVDAQRAYRVGYVAHNHHFLWAAASMEGRSAEALAAARAAFPAACGTGPRDRSTGILQHYFALPYFTLVRFGRWREILDETLPPDVGEPYPLAIWHYARGTAFARTGRIADARRARSFASRTRRSPPISRRRKAEAAIRSRCSSRRARSRTRSRTTSRTFGSRRRVMRWVPRSSLRAAARTPSACIATSSRAIRATAGRSPVSRKRSGFAATSTARARPSAPIKLRGNAQTSRCPGRGCSCRVPLSYRRARHCRCGGSPQRNVPRDAQQNLR